MKIGYARVSSEGQSLDVQLAALAEAGCEKIFEEKASGASTNGREQLELALQFIREGDVLVVTRLDRLARSTADLLEIVERITAAGGGFTCLHQAGIDTTTPTGKLMLTVLGAIAEFERSLIKERQAEGIAKAKERGVYGGRKPEVDRGRVLELWRLGQGATEICRTIKQESGRKIGRTTVYRILDEAGVERSGGSVKGQPGIER